MKKILVFFTIPLLYLSFSSCNNSQAGSFVSPQSPTPPVVKSTQELRRELAEREELNPSGLLVAYGNMRENKVMVQKQFFFRPAVYQTDGQIITGFIHSKASVARFKDAVIRVTFYTETQTALQSMDTTLYKYFTPRMNVPFEMKVYPPPQMKNFTMQVINATPLD
jgi:hypothetical protein